MRRFPLLISLIVPLTAAMSAIAAPPGEGNETAMRIATAYGIDGWAKIERLDFTFRAKLPGRDEAIVRHWRWWPKQNRVKQRFPESERDAIDYDRGEVKDGGSKEARQADKHFINDHYWLLFPFQPVWSNPSVTDEGEAPLPIGEGNAKKVVVQYPSEGGYTPGDAYWLYVDDAHRIVQWQYLPGGDEREAMAHTWQKHRRLGPIVVSLEHTGPNGDFRLWFTDVTATLTNGKTVTPKPMTGE